ncbi:Hypothetical predicted protein [Lecanosticta acicola]|uniref:Uncharacterized protein n=1 Tax=Lecanosticta acicola TaxID=111012 RepID=A0AAI8YUT1_9PEZI|nr:Hypothetical predicted protein [Lecanosticta acicola]
MTPPRESASSGDGEASRSSGPRRNPPLVIVSERGRHSEASRRIVRAQAARASAAQSRETRARNREDRHQRDGPQSPPENSPPPPRNVQSPNALNPNVQNRSYIPGAQEDSQREANDQDQSQDQSGNQESSEEEGPLAPLKNWIINVLHLSANSFAASAAILASTGRPQLGNASEVLSTAGGFLAHSGSAMESIQISGGLFNRRLPVALPRGFANLQQRIAISDAFLVIISRTACFDFASPGVENRLHELLFDIVMTSATATLANTTQPGHSIQSHLRIACTCLTIFQGQRADGMAFAHDQKYSFGLEAAWSEATVLDQNALKEPKSAEAALWSLFIISVTCNSTVHLLHFQQLLWGLLQDLQLRYWEQVRNVLLDFIYPGSFLDEPCKAFYDQLQNGQVHAGPLVTS